MAVPLTCRGALLLALALAGALLAAAERAPTEISNNAIVTSLYDLEHPEDGKLTRCESIVQKARDRSGSKRIGVVLTIAARGSERALGSYQYQDGYGGFVPVNPDSVNRFKWGLERCFRAAVNAGFKLIRVLPHVDIYEVNASGQPKGTLWRNVVRFSPLQKVEGYSYEDVLINPAAEALKNVLAPDVSVEFSLAGEQGLSVFAFPGSWKDAMARLRTALAGYGSKKHSFGVCFNWDKVCGCVEPRERDPLLYNRTYVERLGRWKADKSGDKLMGPSVIDVPGTKALLEASDFVGVSGYAPMVRPLAFDVMEISWETAAYEFGLFDISLKDLAKSGKKLIYSEHGLGGCYWDFTIAPDLRFLKEHPWIGLWPHPAYNPKDDPWQKPDYKQFRRDFYSTLIKWAQNGGGPQYQIDGIYTWSVGSFDTQGVHPASTSSLGTFADPEITKAIKDSNVLVQSGTLKPIQGDMGALPQTPGGGTQQQQQQQQPTNKAGVLKALDTQGFGMFSKMAAIADLRAAFGDAAVSKTGTLPKATVFVPTDEAIKAFAKQLGMDVASVLNNQLLATRIVNHLVVPSKALQAGSLVDGQSLDPARGGSYKVKRASNPGANGQPDIVLQGMQNEARVMRSDLSLGPVTAHAINAVLLPNDVFRNIDDALAGTDAFLRMSQLVTGGASPYLEKLAAAPDSSLTFFVPTAKAIEAAGLSESSDKLADVLSYHAARGARLMMAGVQDGELLDTLLDGHSLTVEKASRNGNTVVNLVSDSATAAPAKVTGRLNVIAGKSFLNLIEGVLMPDIQ